MINGNDDLNVNKPAGFQTIDSSIISDQKEQWLFCYTIDNFSSSRSFQKIMKFKKVLRNSDENIGKVCDQRLRKIRGNSMTRDLKEL